MADDPKAYFGIAADKFPDYICKHRMGRFQMMTDADTDVVTLIPNRPIGNRPVLISIEAEVEYIIQMLSKFQNQNFDSFEVNAESECRSWYKAGNSFGKVLALWPGSTLHYLGTLNSSQWQDWSYKYPAGKNKYTYLGNGHSTTEVQQSDVSFYIRNKDDTLTYPVLKKPAMKVRIEAVQDAIVGEVRSKASGHLGVVGA
ncbi:flavin-binding monooxygenase [Penicillium lagena]|uniref:flavin-binding monooxygenase n=1 Tax=Penicillium lagena TaxID=94218 RepID=UPI0025400CB6|nr:flavin-binding monooxygenase [Penicillium lagena]KAJ5609942.1 flavin-binding monooxygenase [Penicillium lagena]